ncbi:phage portal protein [Acidovorax sp. NPDC077693]|uniref:phage portal protein n=1 Tax=unclassified Acidovorax TaxID=2684926 RepID=UPI0037CBC397
MFFSSILSAAPGTGTVSDSSGDFWRGFIGSARTSSGVVVTPGTALADPILQNCVTLLAESLAQLPCEVFERKLGGQREAALDHPAYDVLRYRPNPFQTPYERTEQAQMSAGLRGNSYSFIERRSDGNITALWPLDTEKVQVLKGPDMLPYYRIGTRADAVPMRFVHHVRWHSHNGYEGISPIALHAESIGLGQALRKFASASFANGASIAGVIERPKEVSAIKDQKSIDSVLDQWGTKFAGPDNAKKVALLQEGMTFKPVSQNNVDSEIVALIKSAGVSIARIYKIPLPMVNDLEKASYNTVEQLLIYFVIFSLLPWVKRHEQAMARDFLLDADRKRYFIEFNLAGLLRGDQKSRFEAYAIGRQWGWLSVNDIRRLENLPPIQGGEVYLQPLNMVDSTKGTPDLKNPNTRASLEAQQKEIERLLAL